MIFDIIIVVCDVEIVIRMANAAESARAQSAASAFGTDVARDLVALEGGHWIVAQEDGAATGQLSHRVDSLDLSLRRHLQLLLSEPSRERLDIGIRLLQLRFVIGVFALVALNLLLTFDLQLVGESD